MFKQHITTKCKYCARQFENISSAKFANHIKWCDKNPNKKRFIKNLKTANQQKTDRIFGEYKDFNVTFRVCNKEVIVREREKIFPKKKQYFCSRSCLNSIGGAFKAQKLLEEGKGYYRRVGILSHGSECKVCGYNKIIQIHHIDEDRNNNKPENLIPLCPNCHCLLHHSSKHKHMICEKIKEYQRGFSDKR